MNRIEIKPIHPFPARMAPSIVLEKLLKRKTSLKILDPMSGSGTTLTAARSCGHNAIGFDMDPLAVLMSDVWCSDVDIQRMMKLSEEVLAIARKNVVKLKDAYPVNAGSKTKKFIRYWFDSVNRRQLSALSAEIRKVKKKKERNILWCAFSRLIITKKSGVSLAMDISHSRPHKVYEKAPVEAFDAFQPAVKLILKRIPFTVNKANLPSAKIYKGDARALPLRDDEVDCVITSPPYLNAIDYMRGHKLSLVWMGYDLDVLKRIRSTNIGTEATSGISLEDNMYGKILLTMGKVKKVSDKNRKMLLRYVRDMDMVMA
ncbi:hypothetical protein KA005_46660, partial [bacterium]|nr:hypothetical protein [bacterium]